MLPEAQYFPPRLSERFVRLYVTLHIPTQLGLPKLSITFWDYAVKRTLVPEAAINEDR
jgi:hypothetical protein